MNAYLTGIAGPVGELDSNLIEMPDEGVEIRGRYRDMGILLSHASR